MAEYSYSISLRIRHPTRDFAELGTTLSLAATRFWKADQPRMSPRGRPLDGVNRQSFWYSVLLQDNSSIRPLSDALDEVIEKLQPHKALLQALSADGCGLELFVGWFFPEGNSGDVIGHRLLERLADLRIDLSFDIYADAQHSDQPAAV
jgi:hypothetical protein